MFFLPDKRAVTVIEGRFREKQTKDKKGVIER